MLIFQALPFPAPVTRARFPAKEISMYPEINNESTNAHIFAVYTEQSLQNRPLLQQDLVLQHHQVATP
jgi:hypothetical protein